MSAASGVDGRRAPIARFAVSATGGVGLVADDTKMGAEASVGAAVKFAGLKLGGDGNLRDRSGVHR